MRDNKSLIKKLVAISGNDFVIISKCEKQSYCKGWRYDGGVVLAVIKIGSSLYDLEKLLKPIYRELHSVIGSSLFTSEPTELLQTPPTIEAPTEDIRKDTLIYHGHADIFLLNHKLI